MLVVKQFTFDAAHYLPEHPGKCRNLHGHTYKLEVGIEGFVDLKTGMVIDFGDLKQFVIPIVEKLDHKCLNDVYPLPTAELMVLDIAVELSESFPAKRGKVEFVRLWETPTSYAEWRREKEPCPSCNDRLTNGVWVRQGQE